MMREKKRTFHALLKILVEDFKNHSFEITLRYYTYKYSFETDLHSMFDNNFFSLSLSPNINHMKLSRNRKLCKVT